MPPTPVSSDEDRVRSLYLYIAIGVAALVCPRWFRCVCHCEHELVRCVCHCEYEPVRCVYALITDYLLVCEWARLCVGTCLCVFREFFCYLRVAIRLVGLCLLRRLE